MRRTLCIILLLTRFHLVFAQNDHHPVKNDINLKIPHLWIQKLLHYNYRKDNLATIQGFELFLKANYLADPDTTSANSYNGTLLNSVSVDLDGDGRSEIISLLGTNNIEPYLCVFKQKSGEWYLIYLEEIDTFYESPVVSVAGNSSPNKVFYLKRVYEHGSDVYSDGYTFYKLVNGRVYQCLELLGDAHIDGWGLFLNQKVTAKFEFRGGEDDEIWANYDYNFFPGAVKDGDCEWCSNEDIPLIKGESGVSYVWDSKKRKYRLDIQAYQNHPEDLTAQKIACFGDFGNDKLFVRAFRSQISQTLKTGKAEQKKLLRKYLAMVKQNGAAKTMDLERKKEAGGTSFYGPKKKN